MALTGNLAVYRLRSEADCGPYTVLAWTDQSVNCIMSENTCLICFIIPNLLV